MMSDIDEKKVCEYGGQLLEAAPREPQQTREKTRTLLFKSICWGDREGDWDGLLVVELTPSLLLQIEEWIGEVKEVAEKDNGFSSATFDLDGKAWVAIWDSDSYAACIDDTQLKCECTGELMCRRCRCRESDFSVARLRDNFDTSAWDEAYCDSVELDRHGKLNIECGDCDNRYRTEWLSWSELIGAEEWEEPAGEAAQ
jgi:hypothetical protein